MDDGEDNGEHVLKGQMYLEKSVLVGASNTLGLSYSFKAQGKQEL